jgi:mRNA-degrading endonuclease toxin of MazEF toxin-antitoxin module
VLILASESMLNVDSKALAEQVRAVDVQRMGLAVGTLGPATMQQLDTALRIHLNL